MSYTELPPSTIRFFARLRTFDIACPRCDRVQAVKPTTNRRIWEPRIATFECMGCHLKLRLGMVAYRCRPGKYKTPDDQRMKLGEAIELRRELNRFAETRLMRGRDTNVLLEELPSIAEAPAGEPGPPGHPLDAKPARE